MFIKVQTLKEWRLKYQSSQKQESVFEGWPKFFAFAIRVLLVLYSFSTLKYSKYSFNKKESFFNVNVQISCGIGNILQEKRLTNFLDKLISKSNTIKP